MIGEDLFTMYGITFKTIAVFSVLSLIVYLFAYWTMQRKQARDEDTFDVAILGVLVALIICRIVGFFVNLNSYSSSFLSLNPFYDINGNFDLFGNIPWAFLRVWDGNLYFPIFGFAVIIGIWLVSKPRKNFIKARIAIDNAAIAIIFGQIVMDVGLFLAGKLNGMEYSGLLSYVSKGETVSRFPLYLVEIAVLILILFIVSRAKAAAKHGLTTAYYLLIYGIGLFGMRFISAGYKATFMSFDYGHVIAVVVILFSLLFFLRSKEGSTELANDEAQFTRMKRADLKSISENKPSFAFSPNRRNMEYNKPSFSDKVKGIFKKGKKNNEK
jgi:prolipoprotein diacylglyceryltransferase